jgi:glutaconate CoA-transferase subunit B
MTEYTAQEMMIVSAARALADARTVMVGVGLPNLACNLARRIVAPELELIYESGAFGARPSRLPLSIGDPVLVSGARMMAPMADLFQFYLQAGRVDVAMLGAAQIDRFGNLNTTVIGDYLQPSVRLPGSGGACEIASNAKRVIVLTRLSKRTFVERLDFLTSPGHIPERGSPDLPGEGPRQVVTDLANLTFDGETKEMELAGLYPGVSREEVETRVSWGLISSSDDNAVVEPPTAEELKILRHELDPEGRYR